MLFFQQTSWRITSWEAQFSKMSKLELLVSVMFAMICVTVLCSGAPSSGRCKLKRYTHKALQTDLTGRRCWDDVKIMSCWGYCLSYEISDWQFPYKESHHPVCEHGERRHASVKLKNCDPNVEPGTEVFHYVEAASCRCQACSSEDTSCEWLPPDISLLGGMIAREELNEEEEID